jgi:hypothetical protein
MMRVGVDTHKVLFVLPAFYPVPYGRCHASDDPH